MKKMPGRRACAGHHNREPDMNTHRTIAATLVAVFAFTLAACEQEGPAERAGKALDNAVEQAGDKIENAGDKAKDALDAIRK
jgi:predicted small lipoprotein YifL